MLSKTLIQFSVDRWVCFPSLLFDLRPNYGGGNEDNCHLLQKCPMQALLHRCQRPHRSTLLTSTGDSWTITDKSGKSLLGSLLLSPGSWCIQGFVCALQESVSPVFCMFWHLYGGVNGNLLQEGLRHTQVCCTQSPCF